MLKQLITVLSMGILASWSASTSAADPTAGKVAAQKCVACHEADDWEGENAASLEALIKDIVAGKVKHKSKLDLSPAEISDIAAYWGQGGKK